MPAPATSSSASTPFTETMRAGLADGVLSGMVSAPSGSTLTSTGNRLPPPASRARVSPRQSGKPMKK